MIHTLSFLWALQRSTKPVLILGLWMERGRVGDTLVCEKAQHKLRRKKRKRVSRRAVELSVG